MVGPDPAGYGGVGTVARTLLDSDVLKSRCEMVYLTSWKGGAPWTKLWVFLRALPAYIWHVQFGRIDIIHLHVAHGVSLFRKAVLAFVAACKRTPYVVQLHSGLIEKTAARNALQRWMVKTLFDAACAVLILHEGARDRTQRLTGNPNIAVLPNPIPPEFQTQAAVGPEGRPNETDGARLLFMGDVVAEKGLVDVLHALTVLQARCTVPIHVDFCGRGDILRMRRLSRQLHVADLVTFHGWIGTHEKARLLRNASVFVHPSHSDELPVAILEALACGLPVVATRVGGIGDAVIDGENGVLVSPRRPDELARAVMRLVEDPDLRCRMGRRSRELARERFGVDRIAERLLAIYRSCLGRGTMFDDA